jgi:hypothetical protein
MIILLHHRQSTAASFSRRTESASHIGLRREATPVPTPKNLRCRSTVHAISFLLAPPRRTGRRCPPLMSGGRMGARPIQHPGDRLQPCLHKPETINQSPLNHFLTCAALRVPAKPCGQDVRAQLSLLKNKESTKEIRFIFLLAAAGREGKPWSAGAMLQPSLAPNHAGRKPRQRKLRSGRAWLGRNKAQARLAHSKVAQFPFSAFLQKVRPRIFRQEAS